MHRWKVLLLHSSVLIVFVRLMIHMSYVCQHRFLIHHESILHVDERGGTQHEVGRRRVIFHCLRVGSSSLFLPSSVGRLLILIICLEKPHIFIHWLIETVYIVLRLFLTFCATSFRSFGLIQIHFIRIFHSIGRLISDFGITSFCGLPFLFAWAMSLVLNFSRGIGIGQLSISRLWSHVLSLIIWLWSSISVGFCCLLFPTLHLTVYLVVLSTITTLI